MKLTAILESWVIPDGSYSPFGVGMPVNLSFGMGVRELSTDAGVADAFESRGDGEYSFAGRVLATYCDVEPLAVVQADGFRFYLEDAQAAELRAGDPVQGVGTLEVDYYVWVENVDELPEPPDLFYNMVVRRIRRVQIPESFISRNEIQHSKSLPCRVAPADFGEVIELLTMEGQDFDEEFYLLDLETIDREVPRSFLE
jgi:hypothetical protein